MAELVGGYTFLTYARFDNTIARTRVPDGQTTVLAAFQNLSDMACFTVSLSRNRWYFHYEGSGQFGGTSETLGYCEASFEVSTGFNADRFAWSPLPRLVQVGHPFPAILTARNSANQIATNFSGNVTVQAVPAAGGVGFPVTVLSNFVGGVWSGFLTIPQVGVDLQLRAEDVDLHIGLSQLITAAPTNDLALLAETRPNPVLASEMFSYVLTITNLGPTQATGVTLTNVLSPEVVFIRTTNTQGSCQQDGGVVRCDLGSLPGSSSATVEIVVAAPATALTLTNRTSIGRAETDALLQDNTVVLLNPVMLPTLSISDASLVEGDSATADMVFQVSLSSPRTNIVRVSYTTVNGTAIGSGSRADFTPRSAQLTFQPGITNLTIAIPIRGDVSYEANETFVVQLFGPSGAQVADNEGVGTILNDDESPTLTIQDVSVVEGNTGVTQAVFQITLSKVSGLAVPVVYATSNGTAQAGVDYRSVASNFTFQANSTSLTQTVVVPVFGDNAVEPDERFYLNLLSVSNAIVLRSQAIGTIIGDDGAGFLDHFQWEPLANPQPILRNIPVTITARDVFGDLVDFDGPVALSGHISRGSASSIVITEVQPGTPDAVEFANVQESPVNISGWVAYIYDDTTWPAPAATFNFPPGTTVAPGAVFRITEFGIAPGVYPEFLTGENISWTHSIGVHVAVLLANAGGEPVDFLVAGGATPSEITNPFTPSTEQWEGPVVPADEDEATTYQRLGNLDHHNNSDWTIGMPSLGSLNTGLTIPFTGGKSPVAISPTNTANFAQGTWHGTITLLEAATNMTLEAADSAGHRGNSNPFDAVLIPAADLAVMLQAQPNPAPLNGELIYSVLVTNRGPGVALTVFLTNTLPSTLTLQSVNNSPGDLTTNNNILLLALHNLAPNAVAVLTVTARPNSLGSITNKIDVSTTSQDPLLLNNHAEVIQTVWVDSDGDGMSDEYENAHQFNPLDPADAGLDSDQDGQTNLEESRAGTDPHDPASVMRITSIEVVGNDVCIRFTGVSGKLYRLERRQTDPGPWETVLIFRVGRSLEVKVIDAGGAHFPMAVYRVQLAQ